MAITQGNILLAQATASQFDTSARPNVFAHITTDGSLGYSPDGSTKYFYDNRDAVVALISAAGANQSLNTTDNVAFNSLTTNFIDFNTASSASYQLGRLHWSDDDKTLDLDLDGGSVLQIGQETLIRGQNSEVDTMTNGTVVYIGGAQGNRPKMYRADADAVGKSKVIAIATQSIPSNQTGFFTAFGLVRDINTSAWNEGDELFLSTSAGIMTNVKPTAVDVDVVSVGFVIRKSATVGSIFFTANREVSVKDLPKTYQPWLGIYRDTSTLAYQGNLSYNQATRQVSLSAPTSAYPKNQYGQAITIPAGVICTHPNTTGNHYIYVDEAGVIQCSTTAWNLTSHCPVAFVYYNASQARGVCFEERHSHDRNAEAHKQQHLSIGTFCSPYPAMAGYSLAPSYPTNADNTWNLTSFTMYDEDIKVDTNSIADNDTKSVLYKSGSSWAWALDSIYGTVNSATYISYNPGGVLTELTNGEFTNYYVFGAPSISGAANQRIICIPSQNKYSSLLTAEQEFLSQGVDIAALPIQEWVLLFKITWRCAASYTTTGKCRIENVESFQNTRSGSVLGGTGVSQTFTDATYLRLDGSNDPVNGDIVFTGSISATSTLLGPSVNVGLLGNSPWLKVADFQNTDSGTSYKFETTLYGGDWNDHGIAKYVYTSFGTTGSSSAFTIRRTEVHWRHGSNEFYNNIQWKVFRENSTNDYEVYVRAANVDYFTLNAETRQMGKGSGEIIHPVVSASVPTSATHTELTVIIDEQPVRMLQDSLFVRDISKPREYNFQYTSANDVLEVRFGNDSFFPAVDNKYTLGAGSNRWANIKTTSAEIGNISATSITVGSIDNTEFSFLNGTSANIQTQLNNLSAANLSFTRNIISVASNTSVTSTGRHLSATIPANTISQTVPTQVKVVGKIGANYVGGTATIEIEIGGNNIFTHTLTASGQNEDDVFEIDFGIRYAGSSIMECFGLCKIDNIVLTTQTPKMRYISSFFTGVPTTAYVFDVKSTITGTAVASITLVKVTQG